MRCSDRNVLLFFVGLTGAAAIAERSGLVEALAGTSARRSGGSPRRLLVVLVARFGLEPLPYVFACTFVADAASLALPVSNPVNVIVTADLGISAIGLVPVLLPAAIAAVAALLGCLLAIYRRQLPAAFVPADAVHSAGLSAASAHAAAIGTMIGADLGPNLTPVGPVATLLWFVLLRQRDMEVSTWSYIRIGFTVAPVTILAALGVGLLLGVPR